MYERSYHAKVVKKDPKIERRERSTKRLRHILIVFGSIVVVVGIIIILKLPALQVRSIDVHGTEVVDPVDIQTTLYSELEGHYLWIFPKTSIFLVPLQKLQKELLLTLPRLQSVSLRRVGVSGLSVVAAEYHPTYLWCVDESTCYLMDQSGSVYSEAPYFSGSAYPKIFKGSFSQLPFSPLVPDEIMIVQKLLTQLPPLGIQPSEFYFDSEHTVRVSFMHNGAETTLYIDPTLSIENSLSDFVSGLHTDPFQSDFNASQKILLYIDMRYSGKVIYKFQ